MNEENISLYTYFLFAGVSRFLHREERKLFSDSANVFVSGLFIYTFVIWREEISTEEKILFS